MITLAPIALLLLALLVPNCTGTIWGNLMLLVIVTGIFIGTLTLGRADETRKLGPVPEKD